MAFDTSGDIQKRIERSIFHKIRKLLVLEGYLPDIIQNPSRYTNTAQGRINWETDLKAIATSKKFAVEAFGHSSYFDKELKKIPRVVIIPRRQMPGDIGTAGTLGYEPISNDPANVFKTEVDYHSTNLYVDINLVTQSAEQDRFLHYILNTALGVRRFIEFYDNPNERFLMEQFNYYDLPNTFDNIDEKAYSYKIPDVWLFTSNSTPTAISRINEITVNTDINTSMEVDNLGNYISTEAADSLTINLSYLF